MRKGKSPFVFSSVHSCFDAFLYPVLARSFKGNKCRVVTSKGLLTVKKKFILILKKQGTN